MPLRRKFKEEITRREILAWFHVNNRGIITGRKSGNINYPEELFGSGHQFIGQPLYMPALWWRVLSAVEEGRRGNIAIYKKMTTHMQVGRRERAEFPELGNTTEITVAMDELGLVKDRGRRHHPGQDSEESDNPPDRGSPGAKPRVIR